MFEVKDEMAKRSRQAQKRGKGNNQSRHHGVPESVQTPQSQGRRKLLRQFRTGSLVAIAALGGSWWVGSEVIAGMHEADLTRIGNGTPTIVQIHDPGCPTCRALQREARAALTQFDEQQLQYLVANIRKETGKQLAAQHRVEHVTLLLFDGSGKRRMVLRGLKTKKALVQAFSQLLAREGTQ